MFCVYLNRTGERRKKYKITRNKLEFDDVSCRLHPTSTRFLSGMCCMSLWGSVSTRDAHDEVFVLYILFFFFSFFSSCSCILNRERKQCINHTFRRQWNSIVRQTQSNIIQKAIHSEKDEGLHSTQRIRCTIWMLQSVFIVSVYCVRYKATFNAHQQRPRKWYDSGFIEYCVRRCAAHVCKLHNIHVFKSFSTFLWLWSGFGWCCCCRRYCP